MNISQAPLTGIPQRSVRSSSTRRNSFYARSLVAACLLGVATTAHAGTVTVNNTGGADINWVQTEITLLPVDRYIGTDSTTDFAPHSNSQSWNSGDDFIFSGNGPAATINLYSGGLLPFGTAIDAGTLTFSSNGFTLSSAGGTPISTSGVTVTNANDTATISANIVGSALFTKSGAGTLVLSAANSYTGGTSVTGGTLLVNNTTGSGLGSGPVSVTTGTLGGTGIINASVTVSGNITGGGIDTVGTLTANAITLTSAAHYVAQIDSATKAADRLAVTGSLDLGAGVLDLTDIGSASVANGTKLTIASYNSLTGTFSNYTQGQVFTLGQNQWQFSYNDGNAITLTAVPEPGTYGLVGASVLASIAWVRRRKRVRVA